MMEQKGKFIIFGLIGILLISLFIAYQNYSAKAVLQKERDKLIEENTSLTTKINKLISNLRNNEDKINSLNSQLDEVSQKKEEIEKKYDLFKRGQEELVEKLKSQQAQAGARPQLLQAMPQTTDAYWAGILKAKTDLDLQLDSIRAELKTVQISNEQLQREKSGLELEVNNVRRDNEDLKRQLDYNQKVMDSIAQELVREKNDKIKIQDSFKLVKNENAVLMRQLKSLNNRKIELEKKLRELQEEKAGVERRFTEMETMLTDNISKINELKGQMEELHSGAETETSPIRRESVELPPIIVRPQGETSASVTAVSLVGKVLAVNRDNNFVIIDLGEDSGIKVGDSLKVYREDKAIADIEVIQTRASIAACDIKKESRSIIVGDTVR